MLMTVKRKLHLYRSPWKRLSSPTAASNKLLGAIRGGFLSSFSVPGTGTFTSVEPNWDARHVNGKGVVGVACCAPQKNPASYSRSAVSGFPNGSIILIAGWPPRVVDCGQSFCGPTP